MVFFSILSTIVIIVEFFMLPQANFSSVSWTLGTYIRSLLLSHCWNSKVLLWTQHSQLIHFVFLSWVCSSFSLLGLIYDCTQVAAFFSFFNVDTALIIPRAFVLPRGTLDFPHPLHLPAGLPPRALNLTNFHQSPLCFWAARSCWIASVFLSKNVL